MDDQKEPAPPAPLNGAAATEPDEETILGELYGDPVEGVYYGASVDDDTEEADQ